MKHTTKFFISLAATLIAFGMTFSFVAAAVTTEDLTKAGFTETQATIILELFAEKKTSSTTVSTETKKTNTTTCVVYGNAQGIAGIQRAINQLLVNSKPIVVDGKYGEQTRSAVFHAQATLGVPVDGKWGRVTNATYIEKIKQRCALQNETEEEVEEPKIETKEETTNEPKIQVIEQEEVEEPKTETEEEVVLVPQEPTLVIYDGDKTFVDDVLVFEYEGADVNKNFLITSNDEGSIIDWLNEEEYAYNKDLEEKLKKQIDEYDQASVYVQKDKKFADGPRYDDGLDIGEGEYTLEAWIKADVEQRTSYPMVMSSRSSWYDGFFMALWYSDGQLYVQNKRHNLPRAESGNLKDGQWHHVTAVRKDGYVRYYLDGVFTNDLEGYTPYSFDVDSNHYLYIGNDYEGHPFYGSLENVRAWNIARTDQQIAEAATSR